jgi:hypothetical protein
MSPSIARLDTGTTFNLCFPCLLDVTHEASATMKATTDSAARETILVVEDDERVR